jgi:hypothetical protein
MFSLGNKDPVVGGASITIERPVEEVFRFIGVDFFRNYPKWSPEVIELCCLSEGPVRAGTLASQVRIDQGHRSASRFRVTAYEENRRLRFDGVSNPYRCSYEMLPLSELSTTRLSFGFELLQLELFMRPFEKLIRVVVQDGAERTVRNLKRLIEARTSAAV